ncbi:MAG: hypothetical protein J7L23_02055 [Candidatus Diapherotrites archaeon]|nr:hypothetical protein [Candidatus Diapherotrites archaeon]
MVYYDLLAKTMKAREVAEELGFKTYPFVELQPEELDRAYDSTKVVFVRGGTLEQNKKIVRSPCDVILDATSVDSAVVQVAIDNNVTFGISLHQFLYSKKLRRAKLIGFYTRLVKLYNNMGANIVLVSGATNNFEARPPEQLASLGMLLGQTKRQAKWSISKVPESIISRKKGDD